MRSTRGKTLWPAMILAFLMWMIVILMIFFVDPALIKDFPLAGSYLPFMIALFLAVFLSISIIFSNSRLGFLIALTLVIFGYLRTIGLGNWLNAILMILFVVILDLGLSSKP